MNTIDHERWVEWNQRYLSAALDVVSAQIGAHFDASNTQALANAEAALALLSEAAVVPAALDVVVEMFELSAFERALLLLCAGVELNGRFLEQCAANSGAPTIRAPSFGLALAALPGAHWSALNSDGPLRGWELIHIELGPLTSAALRIDEQVLHFLCGVTSRNPRLDDYVRSIDELELELEQLIYPDVSLAVANAWAEADAVLIHLSGNDRSGKRRAALEACANVGLGLTSMVAEDLPPTAADRHTIARLWNREVLFTRSALLIELDEDSTTSWTNMRGFVRSLRGPVLLASSGELHDEIFDMLRIPVERPPARQREQMWAAVTDDALEREGLRGLATQFDLGPIDIIRAGTLARRICDNERRPLLAVLWELCSARARSRMRGLAEHIQPRITLEDLVVPAQVFEILTQIRAHVRHQVEVYETWGFADKGTRGLGISALFSGPSGTGKTMAAEALANELNLDLYRIDLSAVVSKYIGETEKNLRRVFEAAESGGSILLFDEADALFGKRSEVKDSRDRYANIEVGYLLQQMEAYRGLAILTSNLRDNIDDAFMRRIRFAVRFPFPDATERQRIWERILPTSLPVGELDYRRLAQLEIAGGNIRNIALIAAFLAAEEAVPAQMRHFLTAARIEYTKLDEPLSHAELVGWT